MYNSGLVAVIVANGKIVREMNNAGTSTVYLPFGCEYSIRLKNQENRRAAVKISIDGDDALSGHQLVVEGNSESEVKGKLDSSGDVAKNAFRFIEKSDRIREHRGNKIDDGIVRIEFQFEEPVSIHIPRVKKAPSPWDRPYQSPIWYSTGGPLRGSSLGDSYTKGAMPSDGEIRCQNFSCSAAGASMDFCAAPANEDGITVAGSHVNQKFGTTYLRALNPTKHVIVFQLKGAKTDGQPIIQPVLARKKVQCSTCGQHCKSSNKFCPECSTCLV